MDGQMTTRDFMFVQSSNVLQISTAESNQSLLRNSLSLSLIITFVQSWNGKVIHKIDYVHTKVNNPGQLLKTTISRIGAQKRKNKQVTNTMQIRVWPNLFSTKHVSYKGK